MITLISSVLGFGTSFLPKVLGFFEEKRDQAHELKMMDKQLEQQIKIYLLTLLKAKLYIKNTPALPENLASGA